MNSFKRYRLYSKWFDSGKRDSDLKEKSIKGGISTSVYQVVSFGLNMLATFVMARILLPSDFGLVGMVTAFTGLASIVQDLGLSMAVVQREQISHRQVSNLFWVNIFVCLCIGLVFVCISPLIVSLYHNDSRIYPILFSYAAGIAIGGVSIQHNALLTRRMKFALIAKGQIISSILSVFCGVGAALLGMGYWAIVILNLSVSIFYSGFAWLLCDWRPSLPSKSQGIVEFLHFGAGISGFNIINYFSRNSDNVLLGQRLGPTVVGFYSKAFQLLMLPLNQLRNPLVTVALPAMSALSSDPMRYINYYKKYVFLLSFFSMPVVVCLGFFSNELILIVLGKQWLPSGQIFRGLAISGFIQPVASSIGLVMISSGHSSKYFIWGCINAAVTIGGFLVGIHWGVNGIVYSLAITTYGLLLPSLWFAFRGTPLRIRFFFNEILSPICHTAILCFIVWVLDFLFNRFIGPLSFFCLVIPIGIGFYYLSWKCYPSGRKKVKTIEEVVSMCLNKVTTGMPIFGSLIRRITVYL